MEKTGERSFILRSSEIGNADVCGAMLPLKAKHAGEYEESTSPQLEFGTSVHTALENTLNAYSDPERDITIPQDFPSDVAALLRNYETLYPVYDLVRSGIIIQKSKITEDETPPKGIVMVSDRGQYTLDLEEERRKANVKGWSVLHQINQSQDFFDIKLNPWNLEQVHIMSKTRGPNSHMSCLGIPYHEMPGTSIEDAIYPEMFRIPLTKFEERYDFSMHYSTILPSGKRSPTYSFIITGQYDAASSNGELVVDWKTSSKTPMEGRPDIWHVTYYVQQTIYRILDAKERGEKPKPGHSLLAFIVKNKTPKFMPIAPKITRENYINALNVIKRTMRDIIILNEEGQVPEGSVTSKCNWCDVKDICPKYQQAMPANVGDLNYLINTTAFRKYPKKYRHDSRRTVE